MSNRMKLLATQGHFGRATVLGMSVAISLEDHAVGVEIDRKSVNVTVASRSLIVSASQSEITIDANSILVDVEV